MAWSSWMYSSVLVVVLGCGHPWEAPAPPNYGVRCPLIHPTDGPCRPPECTGNSPITNTFPVNGLAVGGTGICNPVDIQLIPQSLQGGGCRSGTDLTIDSSGTKLVGMRGGSIVCHDEELAGSSFIVRSNLATITFTIAEVRHFATDDPGHRDVTGYRIEIGGASACDVANATRVRRELLAALAPEFPPPSGLVPFHPGPNDDLVIPVPGPIYRLNDTAVDPTTSTLFNLACVGDALAKRTLDGLYTPGAGPRNQSALKLLTATYCEKPYTAQGIDIEWLSAQAAQKELEAEWGGGKAGCLDTPRLTRIKDASGGWVSPKLFPRDLQPKGCEAPAGATPPGICDEPEWTQHVRDECGLAKCPAAGQVDFRSFIHPNSTKISFEAK
jgi:ADYC domain-containing protein